MRENTSFLNSVYSLCFVFYTGGTIFVQIEKTGKNLKEDFMKKEGKSGERKKKEKSESMKL